MNSSKCIKQHNLKILPLQTRLEESYAITCPIARETALATSLGYYLTPSGKKLPLRLGTQLIEESRYIMNFLLDYSVPPKYDVSTITVIDSDCLQAAQNELQNGTLKAAVLMLASPIEPGGAMLDGNNGQEEDLCRRSNIFSFMWDQSHYLTKKIMYNLVDVRPHQVDPDYASMNNNRMIHVPNVTVFRSGKENQYTMLENPFEIGMLISPGLDRPRYEMVDGQNKYVRSQDQEQLEKLVTTQLKTAYDENYDTLILGAFGCGAFWNPPELIAACYKNLLETKFQGAFKKIVFSILDDPIRWKHNPHGNLKPFQDCFK